MKDDPLLVDMKTACAALGGISRQQLARIVDAGQLPIVRLPGGRDRKGRGTTHASRRVFFALDDLRKLVRESKEQADRLAPGIIPMKKRA